MKLSFLIERYSSRFVLLDIVRIVAITLVLISHVAYTLHLPIYQSVGVPKFYYTTIGGLGISLFLVLSGIVLRLKYNTVTNYWQFIGKRLLRIYPTYWITLAVTAIIYSIIQNKLVLPDILSITGFAAFAGKWGGFLPTAWFIGLIISLYFLYPILAKAIKTAPVSTIIILLAVSILSRIIVGSDSILPSRALDWFPLCRVFEFGLGIFIGQSMKSKELLVANRGKIFNTTIGFIGFSTFPLFLIHYPLLSIITTIPIWGLCIFLVASKLISLLIWGISVKLENKFLDRITFHQGGK